MRHLKSYKLFLEESDFDVELTDKPDVKAAKEDFSDLEKDLAEYKAKKSKIDDAYLKIQTDPDLQKKIDEIVGKEHDNPFITEYLHVASLKRKIDKLQKDISNDKIKQDDFNNELKLSTIDSIKQAITGKIKDVTDRISTNKSDIASLSKEINDAQSSLDKKMKDIEKSMMDNIKNLSDESSK